MVLVSTKKGDTGQTSVIGGARLDKDAPILMVLGDIDELNSWIGVVIALLKKFNVQNFTAKNSSLYKKFTKQLFEVQQDLFTLSAQIAGSTKVKLNAQNLKKLERHAQQIQLSLAKHWHTKFVFPGGGELAAWTDIARAVARRSERSLVAYSHYLENQNFSKKTHAGFQSNLQSGKQFDLQPLLCSSTLPPLSLKYLNRLSDYLYLLRHKFNELENIKEIEF